MNDDVVVRLENHIKFNFRVAGMFVNNNKILLQRNGTNEYYSLLGGRVKYMESTFDAIKREVLEETGVTIKDDEITLIEIAENFFNYKEDRFHELLYVFRIDNKEINKMDNFYTKDKDDHSINKWIELDKLNEISIRPDYARKWINQTTLHHEIIDEISI